MLPDPIPSCSVEHTGAQVLTVCVSGGWVLWCGGGSGLETEVDYFLCNMAPPPMKTGPPLSSCCLYWRVRNTTEAINHKSVGIDAGHIGHEEAEL